MAYKKYVKGEKEIIATEKAFKVIYEKQGFVEKGTEAEAAEAEAEAEVKADAAEEGDSDLESLLVDDLKELAKAENITGYSSMKKAELIEALK